MRFRVLSSIALMIGFYALALGIAFGLLFAVYAEVMWAEQLSIRLTIFAVITAGVILWSILPRFDRFAAPGPRLLPESQPELLGLVRGVAEATGEAMPAEVYLVPDVNAFVMHRGGISGIGSRRVMGIGLPLLQTLTVSQLRAVLAHEFGHYAGGDLKLGGWIYKTRAAMGRTVTNLARTGGWVHRPFLAYGNFFMRVTQKIARAQELAADRMAVRVAGASSHAAALKIVHGVAPAFGAYWQSEVVPVLSNGYRPPIGPGFAQFLRTERVAKTIDAELAKEIAEGKGDPYDSHPPLKERLAAIADMPDISPLRDDPPAVSLIRDLLGLEHELLVALGADPQKMTTIDWRDTPAQVFLPHWRARAAEVAGAIGTATAADVPALVISKAMSTALGVANLGLIERDREVRSAIGSVVAAKLVDDGWSCTTSPGEQIVFTKDGRTFQPFLEAMRNADAWQAAVRAAGIESLPLG